MPKSEHPIVSLNRTLHRLPLVLEILHELSEGASCKGDDEIKAGCHHAVKSMVAGLRKIPDHGAGGVEPPPEELKIATTWLLGERPRRLLPADLYEEIAELVETHVPQTREAISSQSQSSE